MEKYESVDWSKWDSTESNFKKYAHIKSNLIYGELTEKEYDTAIMIPTFRRADLLEEAIDSALNQVTKYKYYIAVVDNDGEVDQATDELLKKICAEHKNVLYYRNEQNIGMFGNWNRCIELAQTEWFCMLHDDDLLGESYIDKLYRITKNNSCGIIGSYKSVIDNRLASNWRMSETGKGAFTSLLIKLFIAARRGNPIKITNHDIAHCILFPANVYLTNKKCALLSGGYDDGFFPYADQFFFQKTIKYSGAVFVPIPLYYYRIAKNESLKESAMYATLQYDSSLLQAVLQSLQIDEKKRNKYYSESLVIFFHIGIGIKHTLDFQKDVEEKFHLDKKYRNKWLQRWIMLKFNLRWGLLLFR